MIRAATTADLDSLRRLARDTSDAPYDLGAVIEEKCFGDGLSGPPVTRLFEAEGALRGFSVQCGKYLRLLAVDRNYRRRGAGTALLNDATVIAAEPGNYFTPGVVESDRGTIAFLTARGFRETASTWNLTAVTRVSSERDPSIVRPADPAQFLAFVEREFGRAWRFEAARAFERPEPAALWIEGTGFVVWEANNRGLGTFGPTGVAAAHRGRGYGRALLLAARGEMAAEGFVNVTIPWTDSLDFYRRSCGAEAAHRFLTFVRTL